MATPYITPQMLVNVPTGVSWSIIPKPKANSAENNAALTNVCWTATSILDTYACQVLRSTLAVEYLNGPGQPRCNVDPNTGVGVLQAKWWPVTEVLAVQTSPSTSFPRVWTPVASGQWDIRHPLISIGDSASATAPDGGWTIDLAPGILSRRQRSGSVRVQVAHLNGWPHTSLTADAVEGATEVDVDDVTGWTGASGFVYDGGGTEPMFGDSVAATTPVTLPDNAGTAQAGPGVLTLASPLNSGHLKGTVISALPGNVIYASVLACAVQALTGATDALTIQSMPGEHSSPQPTADGMTKQYQGLLNRYLRVI